MVVNLVILLIFHRQVDGIVFVLQLIFSTTGVLACQRVLYEVITHPNDPGRNINRIKKRLEKLEEKEGEKK